MKTASNIFTPSVVSASAELYKAARKVNRLEIYNADRDWNAPALVTDRPDCTRVPNGCQIWISKTTHDVFNDLRTLYYIEQKHAEFTGQEEPPKDYHASTVGYRLYNTLEEAPTWTKGFKRVGRLYETEGFYSIDYEWIDEHGERFEIYVNPKDFTRSVSEEYARRYLVEDLSGFPAIDWVDYDKKIKQWSKTIVSSQTGYRVPFYVFPDWHDMHEANAYLEGEEGSPQFFPYQLVHDDRVKCFLNIDIVPPRS